MNAITPEEYDEMQARLGAIMLRDARAAGHRKGFPAAPPKQARKREATDAGMRARQMAAEGADARTIADATGISYGHAARLSHKRPGPGAKPTPAGIKAREMAAAGEDADAIVAATGLARRTAQKLVQAARRAAA